MLHSTLKVVPTAVGNQMPGRALHRAVAELTNSLVPEGSEHSHGYILRRDSGLPATFQSGEHHKYGMHSCCMPRLSHLTRFAMRLAQD